MAFGTANKLAVFMLVVIACGHFASASSFAKANNLIEDLPTCKVIVKRETVIQGKCVRLRGGHSACQTDAYLDPANEDCNQVD